MAIIKLRGVLVDILVDIAPKVYGPYATKGKKGVSQLIVKCLNALYGTMVASLLKRTTNRGGQKLQRFRAFAMRRHGPCTDLTLY